MTCIAGRWQLILVLAVTSRQLTHTADDHLWILLRAPGAGQLQAVMCFSASDGGNLWLRLIKAQYVAGEDIRVLLGSEHAGQSVGSHVLNLRPVHRPAALHVHLHQGPGPPAAQRVRRDHPHQDLIRLSAAYLLKFSHGAAIIG